ncbi:MAG: hypothetical protein AUJ56_03260 [Zetaproteobacteria bacterium CG1_02_49_23]|nr:MAG: hypothetical protein AUJ56_03260 [Zetaproteobacteria bacterium CG1_02_49_23]
MKHGRLLASATSTIPGIACNPFHAKAVKKLQRFKQRRGPFVLIARDTATALQLARYIPASLRALCKSNWPGPVTLVFPAKPAGVTGLDPACYQKGCLAVRVESFELTTILVRQCGGLFLSSSLNRKGKPTFEPSARQRFRQHRWISGAVRYTQRSEMGSAKASTLLRWTRHGAVQLRG